MKLWTAELLRSGGGARSTAIKSGASRRPGSRPEGGAAVRKGPPPAGGLLAGAEVRVRGLGLNRAGHAGPDAVQVDGVATSVGLVRIRAGRIAVAGLVRALPDGASRRRDLLRPKSRHGGAGG